jgi:protein SCO1/2
VTRAIHAWGAIAAAVLAATLFAARASLADTLPTPQPLISGNFELETLDGRTVTEADYRGKWLLVYFGYTSCPDVCPTVLNEIGGALNELGPLAAKLQPIFITVDPTRDKPKVLAAYLQSFDPRIVGLYGSGEQTEAAAKNFHVYYRLRSLGNGQYTVDHSGFLYVIDPKGKFVKLLTGDLPGHQMAQALRGVVR